MGGVDPVNPGGAGYLVGGVLLAVAGLLLWRWFARRRFHAEVAAEIGPVRGRVRVPQGYWHPSMGPRREPVTELLPLCADMPDATLIIPRQREASR